LLERSGVRKAREKIGRKIESKVVKLRRDGYV
jgi:hypothetical protein